MTVGASTLSVQVADSLFGFSSKSEVPSRLRTMMKDFVLADYRGYAAWTLTFGQCQATGTKRNHGSYKQTKQTI